MSKRIAKLLIVVLSLSGTQLLFQNCSQEMQGNGLIQAASSGGDVSGNGWTVGNINFVENSGATFDLNTTLPSGTTANGTFTVDPAGAQLPSGMTLSSNGILSLGSALVGDTNGVIFVYETAGQ